MKIIADGGYLTYLLASNERVYDIYKNHELLHTLPIMMDGRNNIRKSEYPPYKQNRQTDDPKQLEIRDRVYAMRDDLNNRSNTYCHDELEADDLIAMYCGLVFPEPVVVIANDKDMLQIPNAILLNADRKGNVQYTTFESFNESASIPKSCPYVGKIHEMILYLALIGDKADNVKRILPKRQTGYRMLQEIYNMDQPFNYCYRELDYFYQNLALVLLPHPYIFQNELDYYVDQLDETIDNNFYKNGYKVPFFQVGDIKHEFIDSLEFMTQPLPQPKLHRGYLEWIVESTEINILEQLMLEYLEIFNNG